MPNDYINIDAIAPKQEQMANRGLAGLWQMRDRARYEQLAPMQDEQYRAATELALEDLTQGRPVRQATRDATVRDLPVKSRQLEAQTRGQELGTMFEEAMHPGKVKLGLGQQQLDRGQQGIAGVVQMIAQTPGGPDYVARIGQAIRASGVDPRHPVLQQILQSQTPEEASQKAYMFIKQQDFTNPAYRQATDLQYMQDSGAGYRARLAADATRDSARTAAGAKIDTPLDILRKPGNVKEKVPAAIVILNDDRASPQDRLLAQRYLKQNWQAYVIETNKNMYATIPGFDQVPEMTNPADPNARQATPKPNKRFNPQTGKIEEIR